MLTSRESFCLGASLFIQKEKIKGKTKNKQKLNGQCLVIGYEEGVEFLDSATWQSSGLFPSSLICFPSIGESNGEGMEVSTVRS